MLELDCLYNNTSFWLSLSTCEITYYMSTLSKRVRPLIMLSFNHPKPTKGLDALSGGALAEPLCWPRMVCRWASMVPRLARSGLRCSCFLLFCDFAFVSLISPYVDLDSCSRVWPIMPTTPYPLLCHLPLIFSFSL